MEFLIPHAEINSLCRKHFNSHPYQKHKQTEAERANINLVIRLGGRTPIPDLARTHDTVLFDYEVI